MAGGRVEAAAVVADLDDDAPRSRLDPEPGGACPRMLYDVGEGLASDSEELGLNTAGKREWAVRSLHVDDEVIRCGELRGVLGEALNEPVLGRVVAQLVDQGPHLALRAPCQLADRGEGSGERP